MKPLEHGYIEEEVTIDGVLAIRRRKAPTTRKAKGHFLHVPMTCIAALAEAEIPAKAWALALWIIWHHMVSRGEEATVSAAFAKKAGIEGRSARRHAVNALEVSGLYELSRQGTEAVRVRLGQKLKSLLHQN